MSRDYGIGDQVRYTGPTDGILEHGEVGTVLWISEHDEIDAYVRFNGLTEFVGLNVLEKYVHPGWCDICHSYCYGDCEANGLRKEPERFVIEPYHKGDTGAVLYVDE